MKQKILYLFIINIYIQNIKGNDKSIEINQLSTKYDASMKIYDNDKILDMIYLNLTNHSKQLLSDVLYSYTGRIIYLKEYKNINKLKTKNLNYRIKWIFMFDSIKELSNFVVILQQRKLEFFTNTIIITKNIAQSPFKYFDYFLNLKIFIYYIDNNVFKYLVDKYDYINNDTNNIYARILSKNNKEYNLKHLYIIIYLSLIILIFCVNLFRYNFNSDERNLTFFFIRTVYFFPIIKMSITFLYIMKLKFLNIYNDLFNIGTTSIITFLISTLDIFFKSLFILFSILVSNGIDATLRISNRFQFFMFMRNFILIYIILSSTLVNNKFIKFFPKFLMFCSFSIESGIIYLIYKNKKKSQEDYIKKLNLANLYCIEYIPSIKIKLKMIIWHWRVYFLYFFIILFLNIYNNLYFILETEKAIYFHFTDIVIIFCYCIIYRPRKWPSNFDIFFKNDFNYFDNIYCCKLNLDLYYNNSNNYIENNNKLLLDNYKGFDSDYEKLTINETLKLRNKKKKINNNDNKLKKYYKKNNNYPIVILNPEFFFNKKKIKNENNKNEILLNSINNTMIGIYNQLN